MDARERHAIEYDDDHEPRLLRFPRTAPRRLPSDLCVCGIKIARHWDAQGTWIGCAEAKIAEAQS